MARFIVAKNPYLRRLVNLDKVAHIDETTNGCILVYFSDGDHPPVDVYPKENADAFLESCGLDFDKKMMVVR